MGPREVQKARVTKRGCATNRTDSALLLAASSRPQSRCLVTPSLFSDSPVAEHASESNYKGLGSSPNSLHFILARYLCCIATAYGPRRSASRFLERKILGAGASGERGAMAYTSPTRTHLFQWVEMLGRLMPALCGWWRRHEVRKRSVSSLLMKLQPNSVEFRHQPWR